GRYPKDGQASIKCSDRFRDSGHHTTGVVGRLDDHRHLIEWGLGLRNVISRRWFHVQTAVPDISYYADDFAHRRMLVIESVDAGLNASAKRIFTRKELARERFGDNDDWISLVLIQITEICTIHNGNSHVPKVPHPDREASGRSYILTHG